MKLQYRFKKLEFPTAKKLYIPQYKILGMWMSINEHGVGHFFNSKKCQCSSFVEAKFRIKRHIEDNNRTKEWWNKKVTIEKFKR